MSAFDANVNYLPRYVWNDLPWFRFTEDINDQNSNSLQEKMTFGSTNVFFEKRNGYSKRERMEMIDVYLKPVTKNRHQFLK